MEIDSSKPIFISIEQHSKYMEFIQSKLDELGFGNNRLYDVNPTEAAKIGDYVVHLDVMDKLRLIVGVITEKRQPNTFTFRKIVELSIDE